LRRWSRAWSLPSLSRDVTVSINRRLRTSVARFRKDKNCIEVGLPFLARPQIRREALGHELAHAAVAARHGQTAKIHGEEWQAHMCEVGITPRRSIAVHAIRPKPIGPVKVRYEHRCPVCQMTRISKRRVTGWHCRECIEAGLAGKLQITRLDHV